MDADLHTSGEGKWREIELESELLLADHLRTLSRVYRATLHDIRTPLHTVVLYLELLRGALVDAGEADRVERQSRYVDVIGSEVQRLECMLEALLGQTRIAEGASGPVDLRKEVEDLLTFLHPHCGRHHVEVHPRSPDTPVFVEGAGGSVRRALLSLIMRVLDRLPRGGTLAVVLSSGEGLASMSVTGTPLGGSDGAPQPGFTLPSSWSDADRGLFAACRVLERLGGAVRPASNDSPQTSLWIELPTAAERS